MMKREKQQLNTLYRYLNDATVWRGVAVAAKARAGLHILLAKAENHATINYLNQLKGYSTPGTESCFLIKAPANAITLQQIGR